MTLDKEWLLKEYNGPSINKFNYTDQISLYAVDQILINGHYLYGKNEEFRKAYLDAFNSELTLPEKDLVDFIYKNNFNILYFGLLSAPYLIAQGTSPAFYLEHCSADRSSLLSQFISAETMKNHRPISPRPGMPGYYYKESRTKTFKSFKPNGTYEIVSICPIKNILEVTIEYCKKLNEDAKLYVTNNPTDNNIKAFLEILRDESWSPLLYGK